MEDIKKSTKTERFGKIQMLFCIEATILLLSLAMVHYRNGIAIDTSIMDWGSNYVEFDNGWFVDENILQTEEPVDLICGPYIELKKGTYTLKIEYECDDTQSCLVYAANGSDKYIKTDLKRLRKGNENLSYDFELVKNIDNLEVVVKYNGHGSLKIKNIEISPNTDGLKRKIAAIAFLFIVFDIIVYFRKKWKKHHVLLFLEIAVLFLLVINILIKEHENVVFDTNIEDWDSDYIEFDDGWSVNEEVDIKRKYESVTGKSNVIDILHGPYIALKRGSYSVSIEYECDVDQTCLSYADYVNAAYIKTGLNRLSKDMKSVSYIFTLTEDINNFEVVVQYNGNGALTIKDIKIKENAAAARRILLTVFGLFIILNICVYFKKYIEKNKSIILIICGIIIIVSLPLFAKGIYSGHDTTFHLMRIEGLSKEIQNGNIPSRICSLWINDYGYPISIFYGDILLYMAALLRIIGFPIVSAYKFYILSINIGTVLISYFCFKKIFDSKEIAVLTTLAYTTAGYRIVSVYIRSAVGEYSAMMFLPLIAFAMYKIYTSQTQNRASLKPYALALAIGMAGIMGTHILSTEMVVVTLILICIVLWKKTLMKHIFQTYILAVIEAIGLGAYFIVPFLDYYFNVPVSLNYAKDDVKIIQDQGAYLVQYFSFFKRMSGMSVVDLGERLSITPGMTLMLAVVIGVLLWFNKKATKEIKLLTGFSVFLLFLASNLFPWNYLGLHSQLGKMLSQIQFPWRYIGITNIFLTILLGSICKLYEHNPQYRKNLNIVIIGTCMIMSIFYISDYSDSTPSVYFYDTPELDTHAIAEGGYLRSWTDVNEFSGRVSLENMDEVFLISRNGVHMELYCRTGKTDGSVEVPLLNYKGYHAVDEYGNEYEIVDGANNMIRFSLPAGFSGNVTIDFIEPWYWRIAEIISLISVICLCMKGLHNETLKIIKN